MDLFKSIGSALSFSNNTGGDASASAKQQSSGKKISTSGGGSVGATPAAAATVTSNPFGAAFGDVNAGGAGGGGIRAVSSSSSPAAKATRSSSGSKVRKSAAASGGSASPKKGEDQRARASGSSSKAAVSKVADDDNEASAKEAKRKEGKAKKEESSSLSGGIERALDSMSRSLSKTLNFKSNDAPAASSSPSGDGASGAAKKRGFVPTGAATFAQFESGLPPPHQTPPPEAPVVAGKRSGVTFGSPPSTAPSASRTNSKQPATATSGSTDDDGSGQMTSRPSPAHLTTLQGTSRVKYQGTSVVQGNTVHFLVVAVQRDPADDTSRSLVLIGLLDPLGAVRASTKATVQRCDAIRRLERVKISPREAELSLTLSTASGTSDTLLVDPANGSLLGVLIPYLKRTQGVSAVDGFRTEYWCASDASGQHRAPLFDVEGALDELNAAAVLRLRTHTLKAEDAILPSGRASTVTVDVSTQSIDQARSLLQDDFEHELTALRQNQKLETDALRKELERVRVQVDWKHTEAQEVKTAAEAREAAMVAEIAELKRQLMLRVASTQTPHTVQRGSGGGDDGTPIGSVAAAAAPSEETPTRVDTNDEAADRSSKRAEAARDGKAISHRSAASETPPQQLQRQRASSTTPDQQSHTDMHRQNTTTTTTYSSLTREALEYSSTRNPANHHPSPGEALHFSAEIAHDAVRSATRYHHHPTTAALVDPLALVREKLARSEEYLAQARRRTTPLSGTTERPATMAATTLPSPDDETLRFSTNPSSSSLAHHHHHRQVFPESGAHAVRPATIGRGVAAPQRRSQHMGAY